MFAPRFLQNTALLLCFVLLVGCGFKLRTASVLPNDLQNLVVTANNPDSQLFAELQKSLALSNINTTDSSSSSAELKVLNDSLTRRTLSLFPNGQVAEHELIYTVRYQLIRDKQKPITNSFELTRNYQDDPDNALAKSREMELILNELRAQASNLIIRQLGQY
ncbi:LPS-assembly lipoprotein LptE [Pseudoalteromonas piratica]|uniref:LPS-assembly lipoprotein LptE n=1 Tax=Pseudoalteromonas piratica TaxID=1348114 RepID=A0A0A7EF85_9GAMM|nr:LPS assembly lipoprotein LptE [Pseudoalteromonas piratica]AIY65289.1 lipoprotein [Pseudoalteromonas piratica]